MTQKTDNRESNDRPENYGRFFAALGAMGIMGDRDEVKRQIVWQYTGGRTESLREMTLAEYDRCCAGMERDNGYREMLRKERSATLRLMQRVGIDTSDWKRVNAFCLDRRIAGKEFARLSAMELAQLRRKIRAIDSRGGFTIAAERKERRERRERREAESGRGKTGQQILLIDIGSQCPGLN